MLNNVLSIVYDETLLGFDPKFELVSMLFGLILTIVGYVFKSLAIRHLAKNNGIADTRLAFVPFFNYILLGKVLGKTSLWRKQFDNIGVLVSILNVINFVVSFLLSIGYYGTIIGLTFGFEIKFSTTFFSNWYNQTGVFYLIIYYLYQAFSLVTLFINISFVYAIFKLYAPHRAFMYMLFSVLFDFSFGIILYMIKDNRRVNPTVYYAHYQGYNGFGGGYNGYGQGYQQQKPANQTPEQDPFPEFSNDTEREYPTNSQPENKDNTSDVDDLFN